MHVIIYNVYLQQTQLEHHHVTFSQKRLTTHISSFFHWGCTLLMASLMLSRSEGLIFRLRQAGCCLSILKAFKCLQLTPPSFYSEVPNDFSFQHRVCTQAGSLGWTEGGKMRPNTTHCSDCTGQKGSTPSHSSPPSSQCVVWTGYCMCALYNGTGQS